MTLTPGHGSTVDGVLRRSARRTPARAAVEYRDRTWTYDELDTAVSRAASVLLAEGLSRATGSPPTGTTPTPTSSPSWPAPARAWCTSRSTRT